MRTVDPGLAARYEAACREAIEECKRLGYDPSAWAAMIDRYGAVNAAGRLLRSGDPQSGFEHLIKLHRVDLTIEASVLNAGWASLFTEEVKAAARWRLTQVGVDAD